VGGRQSHRKLGDDLPAGTGSREEVIGTMGIGSGIVLFVIGAVLAFALNVTVDWIDLNMVGYLLMGAGALIFLISLVLYARRRSVRDPIDPGLE